MVAADIAIVREGVAHMDGPAVSAELGVADLIIGRSPQRQLPKEGVARIRSPDPRVQATMVPAHIPIVGVGMATEHETTIGGLTHCGGTIVPAATE